MYKILEKEFKSKTDITEYIKTILHNNKLIKNDSYEFQFLMDLFSKHPEYEAKINNKVIEKIITDKDPHYGTTKCFYIIYDNGRKTDISYTWCVKNLIKESEYSNEWILDFGIHKGKSIYDVPRDYIEWCVKESSMKNSKKTKLTRFLTYGKI